MLSTTYSAKRKNMNDFAAPEYETEFILEEEWYE